MVLANHYTERPQIQKRRMVSQQILVTPPYTYYCSLKTHSQPVVQLLGKLTCLDRRKEKNKNDNNNNKMKLPEVRKR